MSDSIIKTSLGPQLVRKAGIGTDLSGLPALHGPVCTLQDYRDQFSIR